MGFPPPPPGLRRSGCRRSLRSSTVVRLQSGYRLAMGVDVGTKRDKMNAYLRVWVLPGPIPSRCYVQHAQRFVGGKGSGGSEARPDMGHLVPVGYRKPQVTSRAGSSQNDAAPVSTFMLFLLVPRSISIGPHHPEPPRNGPPSDAVAVNVAFKC